MNKCRKTIRQRLNKKFTEFFICVYYFYLVETSFMMAASSSTQFDDKIIIKYDNFYFLLAVRMCNYSYFCISNGEPTLLVHCLYHMSPLNHKRTTSSLAPPICYVAKILQLKDRRFPIRFDHNKTRVTLSVNCMARIASKCGSLVIFHGTTRF